MSDYTKKCIKCGLFLQTHNGEYPSLCKMCADYMKDRRLDKWKLKVEKMKTTKVSYGGFETEQQVDECLYNAIYNKAIDDAVKVIEDSKSIFDNSRHSSMSEKVKLQNLIKKLKDGGTNDEGRNS